MTESNIIVETDGPIQVLRLNRPQVLNALNSDLMRELVTSLEQFDRDETLHVAIITGNEKVFSAGADVKQMVDASPSDIVKQDHLAFWDSVGRISKPIVAAVSGYCLGGGFELVMACDIIVASETARFGQPEINIGVIPGAGGTQRLTRKIGKLKAMEMILTGSMISAQEALSLGIVNKVVPQEVYLEEAKVMATEIASKAPLAVKAAKAAILRAFETPLSQGLEFERKSFFLLFSTEDQKEGMRAFLEKRKPQFKGR